MALFLQDYKHKLILTAIGMAIVIFTASPQTPQIAKAYLAQRGFLDIDLQAPKEYHGRGPMLFPFKARTKDGSDVTGELSLGNFAYLYRIKLHTQ